MDYNHKTMRWHDLEFLLSEVSNLYNHPRVIGAGGAIIRKHPRLKPIFSLAHRVSQTGLGNMAMLVTIVLFYYPFRRPIGGAIFQYGMSANNIRSFKRINACAGQSDLDPMINGKRLSFSRRFSCLFPLSKLWYVSNVLKHQRAKSPFSHAQLVITSAAWLIYGQEDFSKIEIICVASDHSPITMALLHIARSRHIKTCYLQHAPVANHFPPLNYDLAVLFDRQSLALYEEAAANRDTVNKGKVIILPPFEQNATSISVGKPPFRIGIFLNYLFDEPALSALIAALVDHPNVGSIHIRRHPRCKADIHELTKYASVDEPKSASVVEFISQCDIALVPNSGVAIEALHLGVPTFYTPGVDYIENDYYGFVQAGILPIFDIGVIACADKIAAFFDKSWLRNFTIYDETSAVDLTHSQNIAGTVFQALLK